MAKKKVCKNCRIFVKGTSCHICKSGNLTMNWKGRIIIFNPEHSEVAQKIGVTKAGEYAIKIR